jgi:hypothetical protein
VTKDGIPRKTHKINRYIVRLTALKNDEPVGRAQTNTREKYNGSIGLSN